MPKNLLAVSHLQQRAESDCLPICVQMVLAYFGRDQSYERLALVLGTRWFGTPAANILRLDQLGVKVELAELSLDEISARIDRNQPIIAFINTASLPYWSTDTDHVVVVVGLDDQVVYLNDPYFAAAPQQVPLPLFELARLRFDQRCAILGI